MILRLAQTLGLILYRCHTIISPVVAVIPPPLYGLIAVAAVGVTVYCTIKQAKMSDPAFLTQNSSRKIKPSPENLFKQYTSQRPDHRTRQFNQPELVNISINSSKEASINSHIDEDKCGIRIDQYQHVNQNQIDEQIGSQGNKMEVLSNQKESLNQSALMTLGNEEQELEETQRSIKSQFELFQYKLVSQPNNISVSSSVYSISSEQAIKKKQKYLCSILRQCGQEQLMNDPVIILCCKKNCQRNVVKDWIHQFNTCPFCKNPLSDSNSSILQNQLAKQAILDYRKQLAKREAKKRIITAGLQYA